MLHWKPFLEDHVLLGRQIALLILKDGYSGLVELSYSILREIARLARRLIRLFHKHRAYLLKTAFVIPHTAIKLAKNCLTSKTGRGVLAGIAALAALRLCSKASSSCTPASLDLQATLFLGSLFRLDLSWKATLGPGRAKGETCKEAGAQDVHSSKEASAQDVHSIKEVSAQDLHTSKEADAQDVHSKLKSHSEPPHGPSDRLSLEAASSSSQASEHLQEAIPQLEFKNQIQNFLKSRGDSSSSSKALSSGLLASPALSATSIRPLLRATSTPLSEKLASSLSQTQMQASNSTVSQKVAPSLPLSQHLASSSPQSENMAPSSPLSHHLASSLPSSQQLASSTPLSENMTSSLCSSQHMAPSSPLSNHPASSWPLSQHLASSSPLSENMTSSFRLSQNLAPSSPLSHHLASSSPLSENMTSSFRLSQNMVSSSPMPQHPASSLPLSHQLASSSPMPQQLASRVGLSQSQAEGCGGKSNSNCCGLGAGASNDVADDLESLYKSGHAFCNVRLAESADVEGSNATTNSSLWGDDARKNLIRDGARRHHAPSIAAQQCAKGGGGMSTGSTLHQCMSSPIPEGGAGSSLASPGLPQL